ncbi:MAG: hypothetical protein ABJN52_15090 [Litorimonas sp.]
MTNFMDKVFISIGLDKAELEVSDHRGLLYVGIVFASGLATAFLIVILLG